MEMGVAPELESTKPGPLHPVGKFQTDTKGSSIGKIPHRPLGLRSPNYLYLANTIEEPERVVPYARFCKTWGSNTPTLLDKGPINREGGAFYSLESR